MFSAFSINHNFNDSRFFIVVTIIAWVFGFYYLYFKPKYDYQLQKNVILPFQNFIDILWSKFIVKL